jgi:hypothetical protein
MTDPGWKGWKHREGSGSAQRHKLDIKGRTGLGIEHWSQRQVTASDWRMQQGTLGRVVTLCGGVSDLMGG